MKAVFESLLPRDVQTPVRASKLCGNWRTLSFFRQPHNVNSFRNLLTTIG